MTLLKSIIFFFNVDMEKRNYNSRRRHKEELRFNLNMGWGWGIGQNNETNGSMVSHICNMINTSIGFSIDLRDGGLLLSCRLN